jgi:hypothetical protein
MHLTPVQVLDIRRDITDSTADLTAIVVVKPDATGYSSRGGAGVDGRRVRHTQSETLIMFFPERGISCGVKIFCRVHRAIEAGFLKNKNVTVWQGEAK